MLTKELILDHENRLAEALTSNDIFALENLLHDDLLMINSEGHTQTKAIYADDVRSGVLRISEYKPSVHIINIVDDIAIISLTIYVEGTMAGNVISLDLKMLHVWKKVGEGAKIIAMSGVRKDPEVI